MSDELNKVDARSEAESCKPIDETVQLQIGKKLRQQYNSIVEEEIPQRFLDLLELLDRSSDGKAAPHADMHADAGADQARKRTEAG